MNNVTSIRIDEDRACRFRRISDNGFRLAFEVTRQCDMSCKHCFVKPCGDKPTTDEIMDIIRQMAQYHCRKLIITGGEPLLRDDLEQIISAAKLEGLLTDLNSNFYSLTRERVKRLKEAGLQEASVSLYGMRHFHDELTGQTGSFDRTLAGIILFREAGITVDVHGAVWDKMLPCIEMFIDTVQKCDVSSVTFFRIIPAKTWRNIDEYTITPDLAIETISQARRYGSLPIRTIGLRPIQKDECSLGKSIYGIGADMHLMPCLLSRHKNYKQGIDLRKHRFQYALALLETQIHHNEWHAVCNVT